jgi:23S rRNA pseudouridine1911/1915/1917 synthase
MNQHFQFQIQAGKAGERLDVFLAAQLGGLSRMRIANLLAARACLVNAEPQPAGYHLRDGDCIDLTLPDDVPTGMNPEAIALEILYEDEHLIVVVKPSGMLVHPNRQTKTGTLLNALAYHFNQEFFAAHSSVVATPLLIRPGLVHRLDRATSGLMVVAKTQRALSILTTHFHKRKVEKRYLALVEGLVTDETGTLIAPIGHDESRKPPRWIMEDGKYAETKFRVLERMPAATLLEFEPVTGRTNQLRIHAAYIGHPIIGDEIYGGKVQSLESAVESQTGICNEDTSNKNLVTNLNLEPLNDKATTDHRPPTTGYRLCLHASRLAFHHPADGKWMEFDLALPDDIQEILQRRKDG